MKKITFEGAGWEKAESNGVGNCRIRTTFLNDKDESIYFELTGHDEKGHITHLFFSKDEETNYSHELSQLSRQSIEYTKASILEFINSELNCSFDEIVVDNESWDGFKHVSEQRRIKMNFKPHYYIDTRTRERKELPDEHLHHELEILPVISHTFILIDCERLRDGAESEPTFYLNSGFCEEDIPF